jgi:cell division transport system permease protein
MRRAAGRAARRARYDLPLDRDETGRFLPWIVAAMSFLAVLALAGALALQAVAERWDSGLSGTLTVQVAPAAGRGPATLPARVEAALGVLRATPGVARAEPLPQAAVEGLLAPWLGAQGDLMRELPLPALIDVELAGGGRGDRVDVAALGARLAQAAPGATVDDHQAWLGDLLGLARAAEALALGIVLMVALALALAVVFVARAGLAIHAEVVELLHLIGAPDAYVARQFQRHVLGLAARGAFGGGAAAALTLLGLGLAWGGALPAPGALGWAALAAVPPAAAALAALTARLTVLRALARMP